MVKNCACIWTKMCSDNFNHVSGLQLQGIVSVECLDLQLFTSAFAVR